MSGAIENVRHPFKKADVVVIGGGLGGLFTGAILAKNGRKVTIIEKNHTIGGGLHVFRRGEAEYATGMHVFGGFNEAGIMRGICQYLGIEQELGLKETDADCVDEIFMSDRRYRLPRGRKNYVKYLSSLFPHEAEGISRYVDALYRLAQDELSAFFNQSSTVAVDNEQFLWSADNFIAYYIKDIRLRSLLSYLAPLYAGVKGETPAFEHAIVNVFHIEGSSMFVDGSQRMADALARVVTNAGGEIIKGHGVVAIEIDNHRVTAVETDDGYVLEAEQVVSSVDPRQLVQMVSQGAFPTSFVDRVNDATYCYSAFKLFLRLKDGVMQHVNHPRYFYNGLEDNGAWNAADVSQEEWPRCAMAVTAADGKGKENVFFAHEGTRAPVELGKGVPARTMTVVAPISFDWFEQWQDSRVGHRPVEYYCFKKDLEQKLFALLKSTMPELENGVQEMFSSTPLTIRDYNGIHRGSMYGFHKDCNHIMYTKLSVNTKVQNLYLTGQSVNLHGMCGVAITSVMTAEAVLGRSIHF